MSSIFKLSAPDIFQIAKRRIYSSLISHDPRVEFKTIKNPRPFTSETNIFRTNALLYRQEEHIYFSSFKTSLRKLKSDPKLDRMISVSCIKREQMVEEETSGGTNTQDNIVKSNDHFMAPICSVFLKEEWDCSRIMESENFSGQDDIGYHNDEVNKSHPDDKIVKPGNDKRECESCGVYCKDKSELRQHEELIHGLVYRCKVCAKGFSTKPRLLEHEHMHNYDKYKPYKCNKCENSYLTESALVIHRQRHARKMFKCRHCGKTFASMGNKNIHERTQHTHADERPHRCETCGAAFKQKSTLTMHVETHRDDKPYQCYDCNKCFKLKYHMKVHARSHLGRKPHKCDECGRYFVTVQSLMHHNRTHTGEKPFECKECGRRFAQRSSLKSHSMVHSDEKPYECEICRRTFKFNASLHNHMKLHKQ